MAVKLDRQRDVDALTGPADGKGEVTHWDDAFPGLGVRVLATGGRSWIVRYRMGKAQRVVVLGKAAGMSPAEARKAAGEVTSKAKLGKDTRQEITEARTAASETFGKLVEAFLADLEQRGRKASYVGDTRRYLEDDAKRLHGLPVAAVDRRQVVRLLDDVKARAPVAAERCRVALAALFTWAMKRGEAAVNPAAVIGRVAEPKHRDRVLTPAELAAIWSATAEAGDFNAIIRLLMFTGQRREEVAAMTWEEISAPDGEPGKAVWSLAADRTKNGRPHDVPLSGAVLAILKGIPKREQRSLVFGQRKGGFSGWSVSKARLDGLIARRHAEQRLGRPLGDDEKPEPGDSLKPWTIHDIRRSVVTHLAESGIAQPHVIEAIVNHVTGHKGGVAGVYNRATYAAEKRAALARWAEHVMAVVTGAPSNVVPLRRGAARREPRAPLRSA